MFPGFSFLNFNAFAVCLLPTESKASGPSEAVWLPPGGLSGQQRPEESGQHAEPGLCGKQCRHRPRWQPLKRGLYSTGGPSMQGTREKAASQFPLPPLLLKLDRWIEVAAGNQSQDSGLLPPALICSRGREGPYDPG